MIAVILLHLLPEGGSRAGGVSVNLNFTFSIFVCVSILLLHKEKICSASDAASIYGTLNGLVGCLCNVQCTCMS